VSGKIVISVFAIKTGLLRIVQLSLIGALPQVSMTGELVDHCGGCVWCTGGVFVLSAYKSVSWQGGTNWPRCQAHPVSASHLLAMAFFSLGRITQRTTNSL
jgi:hypothetical protein